MAEWWTFIKQETSEGEVKSDEGEGAGVCFRHAYLTDNGNLFRMLSFKELK